MSAQSPLTSWNKPSCRTCLLTFPHHLILSSVFRQCPQSSVSTPVIFLQHQVSRVPPPLRNNNIERNLIIVPAVTWLVTIQLVAVERGKERQWIRIMFEMVAWCQAALIQICATHTLVLHNTQIVSPATTDCQSGSLQLRDYHKDTTEIIYYGWDHSILQHLS